MIFFIVFFFILYLLTIVIHGQLLNLYFHYTSLIILK